MKNKIVVVIKKDLKNRLSQKWFWILALLGPLIFSLMVIIPIGLNQKTAKAKAIEVWQEPQGTLPIEELPKNDLFNYIHAKGNLDFVLKEFIASNHELLIIIPKNINKDKILLYHKVNISENLKKQINYDLIQLLQTKLLLQVYDKESITQIKNIFQFNQISLSNNDSNETKIVIGLIAAIIIYYFTFSYSIQVMRSVMEEKTNRVVEILLTSMKPWQLMTSKILSGSILGLLQFFIWLTLTSGILMLIYTTFKIDRFSADHIQETIATVKDVDQAWEMYYIINALQSIEWQLIIPGITLYFLLGYLLYSAMFAAIGAAVDQDAETQMFIMPVTAPLAASIVFIQFIAQNPDHWWSKFLSLFPLTSPIAIPIKIATGSIPLFELTISIITMCTTICLIIYLAGKIFKTGILNYGNTASWKDILKWVIS